MSVWRRFARWYFSGQPKSLKFVSRLYWWEARRVPFSLICLFFLAFWLLLVCVSEGINSDRQAGDIYYFSSFFETAAIFLDVINIAYTMGFVVEATLMWVAPKGSRQVGSFCLLAGTGIVWTILSLMTFGGLTMLLRNFANS